MIMSNILNYQNKILDFKLSNKEYWDFYLINDGGLSIMYSGDSFNDCVVVDLDFNTNIYSTGSTSASTIHSTSSWSDYINNGVSATTYGFTGIDNGSVLFIKYSSDTGNTALLSALTGTTLVISSANTSFFMHQVSGFTNQYVYPISIVNTTGVTGNYAKFCGGFYQGYYKLNGFDYQVLPVRHNAGWVADLWLNKSDDVCVSVTGNTLNDDYADNTGFFYYMGTRAENKFWSVFNGLNTGCTAGCFSPSGCSGTSTTFCTVQKESNYVLPNGITLDPPHIDFTEIDNKFLMYGTYDASTDNYGVSWPSGLTTDDGVVDSITITGVSMNYSQSANKFLTYCRSCGACPCGSISGGTCLTVDNDGDASDYDYALDVNADIVDNAIGFRIDDLGRIGYRLLTITGSCSGETYVTGVTVVEKYSSVGIIDSDEWYKISIRFYPYTKYSSDVDVSCIKARLGKLGIYVNGKLKLWTDDFVEFIPKGINEHYSKQIGVPFNISLGGGSLGLLESMTFDGQDPNDLSLHIQNNFAGTFIGLISRFRLYDCDLSWVDIENQYRYEKNRYGL